MLLRGDRLSNDTLDLVVRRVDNHEWREDVVEASHNMSFDDLRGHVCDERLLLNLFDEDNVSNCIQ